MDSDVGTSGTPNGLSQSTSPDSSQNTSLQVSPTDSFAPPSSSFSPQHPDTLPVDRNDVELIPGVHYRLEPGKAGERGKYNCLKCERTCTRRSDLKRHFFNVHNRDRRFVCNYAGCGKAFGQKHQLVQHVGRVHTGVRDSFSCSQCSKPFTDGSAMRRHEDKCRAQVGLQPIREKIRARKNSGSAGTVQAQVIPPANVAGPSQAGAEAPSTVDTEVQLPQVIAPEPGPSFPALPQPLPESLDIGSIFDTEMAKWQEQHGSEVVDPALLMLGHTETTNDITQFTNRFPGYLPAWIPKPIFGAGETDSSPDPYTLLGPLVNASQHPPIDQPGPLPTSAEMSQDPTQSKTNVNLDQISPFPGYYPASQMWPLTGAMLTENDPALYPPNINQTFDDLQPEVAPALFQSGVNQTLDGMGQDDYLALFQPGINQTFDSMGQYNDLALFQPNINQTFDGMDPWQIPMPNNTYLPDLDTADYFSEPVPGHNQSNDSQAPDSTDTPDFADDRDSQIGD